MTVRDVTQLIDVLKDFFCGNSGVKILRAFVERPVFTSGSYTKKVQLFQ